MGRLGENDKNEKYVKIKNNLDIYNINVRASLSISLIRSKGGVKIMKVNVYQNKKLVNVWEDETQNLKQLTAFLWRKAILKSNIRVKYSYNYSDNQTITFVEKYENYDGTITTTEYEFVNVPTSLGYLDIYKI